MLGAKVPIVKDLVLLGGGHSHVEVLRSFGMRPMPGVRLTLVTRDVHTPYSGMLPGYISGFYTYDDVHIDLARLASFAKARLIHAEASGLDIKSRRVLFPHRPAIAYDALSIDIGIRPGSEQVPGALKHTTPVKPIDRFVQRLDALLARYAARDAADASPMRVVVVGGGAGGVEVALALQYRLEQERTNRGLPEAAKASVTLVCRGKILDSHTSYARRSMLQVMQQRGVVLREGSEVARVEEGRIVLKAKGMGASGGAEATDGDVIPFDECMWCTQASAASWIKETGLPTDPAGFMLINEFLQSDGGPPEVFGAGDVATSRPYPRPKAGVFAVRQGPPLTNNLRRLLSNQPLEPFEPQSTFLSLITTGDRYCVGTKGWIGMQGAWMWSWKDSIDRTFMRKYSDDLTAMAAKMMASGGGGMGDAAAGAAAPPAAVAAAGPEALTLLAESKMRCGGCGGKVGASVLSRALARLPKQAAGEGVLVALDSPDDAAIVRPPAPGKLLVQTVDFFRSFWDDPYLFGQIAANHALGDVWAMGGQPRTALAMAVVPLMSEALVEEELVQALSGALQVLEGAGCALVGGHTTEGQDLALGFSVTGEVTEGQVMTKGGLKPGQALILTKPLGTGTLMAAQMRGVTKGRHVMGALACMAQPSGEAARILREHGASGCTDVTGFGLLGHLVEMARPSKVYAELDWAALPLLPGAAECLEGGVLSSLHSQNARASASVSNFKEVTEGAPKTWPILVDPQTGGGLLAGVDGASAEACVVALKGAGYKDACIIGRVVEVPASEECAPVKVRMGSAAGVAVAAEAAA